jgi:hypothetical protein
MAMAPSLPYQIPPISLYRFDRLFHLDWHVLHNLPSPYVKRRRGVTGENQTIFNTLCGLAWVEAQLKYTTITIKIILSVPSAGRPGMKPVAHVSP